MNRLIIVGNGFDLAHGLPTGYCDFIDWYWARVIEKLEIYMYKESFFEDEILRISFKFRSREYYQEQPQLRQEVSRINSYKSLCDFISSHKVANSNIYTSNANMEGMDDCKMEFSNKFFEIINSKRSIQNWVDIENEYYRLLKECLKEKSNDKVKKLNQEFEQVKNLLEEYLDTNISNGFNFDIPNNETKNVFDIFNVWNRFTDWERFNKEFSKTDQKEIQSYYNRLRQYNMSGNPNISDFIKTQGMGIENLFLNFNYTLTVDSYLALLKNTDMYYYGKNRIIQIHGKLKDTNNKINFGFGDEMDDDYKKIENKDDNEYLRNIKSFQYLQNSNYKDMLGFIESHKFQVYIMGHSCGLSDRILLNKIFEHHNCCSIKVFYHQFDEPKTNGATDNYTEIVQNISRHFNKKEMMREKIVNKSLCQPLPQGIRFAEKK